jgi:hypothetical protein
VWVAWFARDGLVALYSALPPLARKELTRTVDGGRRGLVGVARRRRGLALR